jgi:hypothetical protein
MAYIGGQLTEITWSHPTLGTGTISPKSSEDSTLDTGGIRSDDETNGIAGDGSAIRKMNIARWSVDTMVANDSNVGKQLEKLSALAGNPAEATFRFTHINGSVYSGSGFPVGDVQANMGSATIKIKFAGSNTLKKIV